MPSCFENPTMAMCADADKYYTAAMQRSDLDELCGMMPYMSGCAVRAACGGVTVSGAAEASEGTPGASGAPCASWTLLFDICTSMPRMSGCGHVTALCGNSSTVVEQCTDFKPTPDLVPYAKAAGAVVSMCASMPGMSGCSSCTSDKLPDMKTACPNPLLSMSHVCMSMSGMPLCDPWVKMCGESVSAASAASLASTSLPEFCDDQWTNSSVPGEDTCRAAGMQMTFHGGLHDAVLFKDWYACTGGQYALVLLLVFVVSSASSSHPTWWQRPTCARGSCARSSRIHASASRSRRRRPWAAAPRPRCRTCAMQPRVVAPSLPWPPPRQRRRHRSFRRRSRAERSRRPHMRCQPQ